MRMERWAQTCVSSQCERARLQRPSVHTRCAVESYCSGEDIGLSAGVGVQRVEVGVHSALSWPRISLPRPGVVLIDSLLRAHSVRDDEAWKGVRLELAPLVDALEACEVAPVLYLSNDYDEMEAGDGEEQFYRERDTGLKPVLDREFIARRDAGVSSL